MKHFNLEKRKMSPIDFRSRFFHRLYISVGCKLHGWYKGDLKHAKIIAVMEFYNVKFIRKN